MTTYVVTKNIIRQIVSDIATAHYQINSFGYGDEADYVQKLMNEDTQELAENVIYPRLFLSPDVSRIQTGSYIRTYVVIVADRIRTGDQNFTEVESDTEQILLDVIAQLQNQDYGFVLDTGSIEVTPFKNRFADMVTGHMASISLQSDFEYDRCQIPESFITVTNPYVPFTNGSNERDPLSWHKQGNSLTTSSVIGSTNNQDWRIIQNSLTIATIKAAGVQLDVLNAKATPGTIFLTTDNGVITSRTAAEVLSDIGAAPAIPTFTEGSVLFAGVGGVISQDNANLFWDDANNRLGLLTTTPNHTLELGSNNANIQLWNNSQIRFRDTSATERTSIYMDTSNNLNVGTSAGGNLIFINGSTYTERARINNTGNFLIGNTTGVGRLNVRGAGTTSATFTAQFHNSTGANNALVIRDDGRVGIGTSAPDNALHVEQANTFSQARIKGSSSNNAGGLLVQNNSTQSLFVEVTGTTEGSNPSSGIIYASGGLTKIQLGSGRGVPLFTLLTATGNVGIGTASPSARLHVVGADTLSGTNALLVQNSAAQNILQLNNANEIGFYGAAPVARQTINSGSTAAVLAEVVAALENLGLIIDNT